MWPCIVFEKGEFSLQAYLQRRCVSRVAAVLYVVAQPSCTSLYLAPGHMPFLSLSLATEHALNMLTTTEAASSLATSSGASSARWQSVCRRFTTSAASTATCAPPTSCGSTRGTPGSSSTLAPGPAPGSECGPTARCATPLPRWFRAAWMTARWWRTRARTCGRWGPSHGAGVGGASCRWCIVSGRV